ncbi:MAG TPA: response regulator transcription factor [Bryobacteraceae bacterium]|nr:response regulator transcription factor [Bryobacteraceae bacterium]
MKPRILLIEDEPALVTIVTDLFQAEGYELESCADGGAGLRCAMAKHFDLLVLDIMLPGLNGLEICQVLRQQGFEGAILILTAKSQVGDRVLGLRTGADDYLTKPFDSNELLARAAALLRRIRKEELPPARQFRFGQIEVDFIRPKVRRNGEVVSLAGKEWQLLCHLIDHRGQVLSREQLLAAVWRTQPFISPRTVDTHVAWLRQKLEADPQSPRYILTVRGEGYRFQP